MTGDDRSISFSKPVVFGAAVALVLLGAVIGLSVRRGAGPISPATSTSSPPAMSHSAAGHGGPSPTSDPAVTLTPEMIKRAGIQVAVVGGAIATGRLRIPGVVQPNAYREVNITSLVDGRITRVLAELGQRVAEGAPLAEMYSPALAELQTSFLAMRADLDAAHEKLMRTERLVQIGAASRQELEQVRVEHTHHQAAADAARARLVLLGVSRERIDKLSPGDTSTTVVVTAPLSGVVTKREANTGVNVQTGAPLFTLVDLSTVWIVADLYESNFGSVRVGSSVNVTADAFPGLSFDGRVSYIDPQVQETTRTAKIRIEVPNRGEQLRLGMFVNVDVNGVSGGAGVSVPRSAVATMGARHIVYVADPDREGRFLEREVQIAEGSGDSVMVTSGLNPGERIVSSGSFYIRAEQLRQ